MSTNLRLSPAAVAALRAAAAASGRTQQDLLREAVDRYLGLAETRRTRAHAISTGLVRPPTPFQDVEPGVKLRRGLTVLDLLDRDER